MAMIEAYFDASGTHSAAKDLCLAGYIFRRDAALAFDADWRQMLSRYELPYFHMKECAHAEGVFKRLGHEGSDCAAREAIDLIKRHASQGIAFSVDKSIAADLRTSPSRCVRTFPRHGRECARRRRGCSSRPCGCVNTTV